MSNVRHVEPRTGAITPEQDMSPSTTTRFSTKDDERTLRLLEAEASSWWKNCFLSAVEHLKLADRLVAVDPAMAVFRAITAEEEAASGLMQALRYRGYPAAEQLQPSNHVHKHAVTPFLLAIARRARNTKLHGIGELKLAFKEVDGIERIVLAMRLLNQVDLWGTPTPPLNLRWREGDAFLPPSYQSDVSALIEPEGFNNIVSFLKREANRRNKILYASAGGIATVPVIGDQYLAEQNRRVFRILTTALMIAPYSEIQPFVAEANSAFVIMLGRIAQAKNSPSAPAA